jgi:hypothetical protein
MFRDPVKKGAHLTRYWADGGLVCAEDQETGEFWTTTVKETLERIKAINDMVGNSRTGKGAQRPDEMKEYARFVDEMITICENARAQGMPDDVKHAKQIVKDVVAKRQSRMVVMPGFRGGF